MAKKTGRNKLKCKAYKDLGIREQNKARKAEKEAKRVAKLQARKNKEVK